MAFVPTRPSCLELQSEQWGVNGLEVVDRKAKTRPAVPNISRWTEQLVTGCSWDALEQSGPDIVVLLIVASIQTSGLGSEGAGASRGETEF